MSRAFDDANSEHFISAEVSDFASLPLSMSIWFLLDDTTGNDFCCMQIQDVDNDQIVERMGRSQTAAGTDTCRYYSDTNIRAAQSADTANELTYNAWNHLVGVHASGTSLECTLNGDTANKGSATGDSAITGNDMAVAIGVEGDSTPDDYWSGELSTVAVWLKALTDEENVALSNGLSPFHIWPGNLNNFYPLTAVAGVNALDLIGGLDGTDTNTVTAGTTEPSYGFFEVGAMAFLGVAAAGGANPKGVFGGLALAGPLGGPFG